MKPYSHIYFCVTRVDKVSRQDFGVGQHTNMILFVTQWAQGRLYKLWRTTIQADSHTCCISSCLSRVSFLAEILVLMSMVGVGISIDSVGLSGGSILLSLRFLSRTSEGILVSWSPHYACTVSCVSKPIMFHEHFT